MSWQELRCVLTPIGPVGGSPDEVGVAPLDLHNAKLLDLVAPRNWKDPTPDKDFVYDLIAIGAGAGGLVSSKQSARRGYRSALVEKHLAGGDCLNTGCVPSKSLLCSAKMIREIMNAREKLGVLVPLPNVDFVKVMRRMRVLRAEIAPADSFAGAQALGVDVFHGEAKFVGPHALQVGGKTLSFRKCVIATGARPVVPNGIIGLESVPYLTSSNIFNLSVLPERLIIVGGGNIACELGQAFALLGSNVTFVLRSTLLADEDDDVRTELLKELTSLSNISFCYEATVTMLRFEDPLVEVHIQQGVDGQSIQRCDQILFATGRQANVEELNLEVAAVKFKLGSGVLVDDFLRTSNPDIFAVGDVCSTLKFTHLSGKHAQMAVENALFEGKLRNSRLFVPRVLYTYPEVGRVGIGEREARLQGVQVDIYKSSFEHNDRAIVDGAKLGFVKIVCEKGTDKILGGCIVATCAGEMLSELTVAMQFGIGLGENGLGSVIHSYPSMSDAIGGCAFQFKMKHWRHKADQIDDGKLYNSKLYGAAFCVLLLSTITLIYKQR